MISEQDGDYVKESMLRSHLHADIGIIVRNFVWLEAQNYKVREGDRTYSFVDLQWLIGQVEKWPGAETTDDYQRRTEGVVEHRSGQRSMFWADVYDHVKPSTGAYLLVTGTSQCQGWSESITVGEVQSRVSVFSFVFWVVDFDLIWFYLLSFRFLLVRPFGGPNGS